MLRATSGENCRSKVNSAQSYSWLSTKGLAEIRLKIDFLAGSNYEAIQHKTLKLTVELSQERLCKNQVSSKSVRVMFFFWCWFDMEWPISKLYVDRIQAIYMEI